jgi:hypothetical protein
VLGVEHPTDARVSLALDASTVDFVPAADGAGEGIVEFGFAGVPALDRAGGAVEVGGVRLRALAPA